MNKHQVSNIGDADPLPHSLNFELWGEGERNQKGETNKMSDATMPFEDRDIVVSSRENYERIMEDNARLREAVSELLEASNRALPFLRNHVCMTVNDGPADRIALDKLESAIDKASRV